MRKDLMFALVMSDPALCRPLLERIFPGRRIRELRICDGSNTEIQKTIITGIVSKNVRLDVLFEDDDTWYALEMQTSEEIDLPMRGRYYSSAMDIDQIKQGARYGQLPHSYVIFICTFDYYKLKQAVYRFQNYDVKNSLPYGDNSYKIVLNTTSPRENTPTELVSFFDYVNNMEVPEDDTFIQAVHARVEKFNTSEWRRKLMTLEEQMRLEQEKAFAEGQTKGRKEGLLEGEVKKNQENAKRMKDKGFDVEDIIDITGLSKEEIEKI